MSSTTTTTTVTTTENCAPSHGTTGSARLDLFFKTVRGIEQGFLLKLLEASWKESPLDTLKLIFQTRDCRGGKGEREIFHQCLNWLIENHPEDLLVNLEHMPEYGRWEDLLRHIDEERGKIGETIAKMFADQLRKDYAAMNDGKPVTLCAKWSPTENCKHDKKFKAVKLICKELGIKKAEYRKQYLSPLREYIKIVERYMCLKQWDSIDYSKVPGNAMNKLKKAFNKHDPERFAEFMKKLDKGEVKVNATTVEPHEIASQFMYGQESDTDSILEGQWREIVKRVQALGNMDHALAVVDVSGSMTGTPMNVAVALGMLICELSLPPFQGKLISFHENPQFCTINLKTSMRQRAREIMRMPWGMSTNFYKVFEMLLEDAKIDKLSQEEMPTSIYVISDMQFNSAAGSSMTNLDFIKTSYRNAGYEMPKLIFWNVNGNSRDFVTGDALENDVAMISGFSPALLKAVLNGDDFSPFGIMMKAIQDERYNKIKLASQ